MTHNVPSIVRLSCAIQNYAWGKLGRESKVAEFARNACVSEIVDETKPYAELWMGTHPNGPSTVYATGESLQSLLKRSSVHLPYLFKVLSIQKALSIQAHPDKKLAEELHQKFPAIYKDDNHKPEMSIALTKFEALCGFRPWNEIAANIRRFPAFASVLGEQNVKLFLHFLEKCNGAPSNDDELQECKDLLKMLFKILMNTDSKIIEESLNVMINNIKIRDELTLLILRLNEQYPNDVGCFCVLLLNYIKLEPGEAFFMVRHDYSYLSRLRMNHMHIFQAIVLNVWLLVIMLFDQD
jgi:mannose-6-phosphate isomerase